MRKLVILLITTTIIITNIHFFIERNNKSLIDFFTAGEKQVIDLGIDLDNPPPFGELIAEIEAFAETYQISIVSQGFSIHRDLNMYVANFSANPLIRLREGVYPTDLAYLSNRSFKEKNTHQSGVFSFPVSTFDIHIYDFPQAANDGSVHVVELIGADDETVQAFLGDFARYGEISLVPDSEIFVDSYMLEAITFRSPLFITSVLSIGILLIVTCMHLLKYRKKFFLSQLWGYSARENSYAVLTSFTRPFLWINILGLIAFSSFLLIYKQDYLLLYHLGNFLLVNLVIGVIFFCFLWGGTVLLKKVNQITDALKGKNF